MTLVALVLFAGSSGGAAGQGRPAYMSDPHAARIERLVAAGKFSEAYGVAKKAPERSSAAVIAWIKANAHRVPPLFLYELSRRTFPFDKDQAVMWRYAGYLRAHYDARRCADRTASRGLSMLKLLGTDVAAYSRAHPRVLLTAVRRALAWEATQPGDTNPQWICIHGMERYRAATEGKPYVPKLKPKSKWPTIRRKMRAEMDESLAKHEKKLSKP